MHPVLFYRNFLLSLYTNKNIFLNSNNWERVKKKSQYNYEILSFMCQPMQNIRQI